MAVWSLSPQGGSEGPTFISRTARRFRIFLTQYAQTPWGSKNIPRRGPPNSLILVLPKLLDLWFPRTTRVLECVQSYEDNVPFLARNFGTFGVHFGYDLFDGGKKRATLRERDAELAQAKENFARISDEVEVRVQTAYNKLERTRQMVAVSRELLATRQEARRVSTQQLRHGAYLRSQADAAVAQEFVAQTLLLQSQLEYAQAQDELTDAIGETAR
jgi:Outer membrane efflux protein